MLELLQKGVSPNNSDYYNREHDGATSLHMACAKNHIRSAELLIKFGAIVASTDNDGWTPLHWECSNNRKATTKLLLEHHCPTGDLECLIEIFRIFNIRTSTQLGYNYSDVESIYNYCSRVNFCMIIMLYTTYTD